MQSFRAGAVDARAVRYCQTYILQRCHVKAPQFWCWHRKKVQYRRQKIQIFTLGSYTRLFSFFTIGSGYSSLIFSISTSLIAPLLLPCPWSICRYFVSPQLFIHIVTAV
ncbi:hypothetical protein BDV12DRAFT_11270 [Aspergillus spectabilis]